MEFTTLRKDQLKLVKTYAVYYGFAELEKLSKFDLVILEPKAITQEAIRFMHKKKTLVLSYISVLEIHPNDSFYCQLKEEDFLHVDGERVQNKDFGTYFVDLKSNRWQAYLKREADYRLHIMNSDGLFLDTIGGLELHFLPEFVRVEQREALLNWFKWLKRHYEDQLFIQNNGLESLCIYTAPFIDGILWENPPLTLKDSAPWVEVIKERLEGLAKAYDLKLFLLFEETVERERKAYPVAKQLAKSKPFLVYSAPEHYVKGVNLI